jgi:hypothetical protein
MREKTRVQPRLPATVIFEVEVVATQIHRGRQPPLASALESLDGGGLRMDDLARESRDRLVPHATRDLSLADDQRDVVLSI